MLERINEIITLFLVGLGQALSRLSDQEKTMVSLLLAFLLVAAAASRALAIAHVGR